MASVNHAEEDDISKPETDNQMKNICRNSGYLAWRRTGGGKGALTDIFKYLELCHKRKSVDSLGLFFRVSEEIIMTNEWKL